MSILNVLVGAALLFFGRKVFWLFIAGVGFMIGMNMVANSFHGPDWLAITVGLVFGVIAALLAVFVQHFAIDVAGFVVGGYLVFAALPLLNLDYGWAPWIGFIVGGILGIILVEVFLDWALIAFSSMAGASLITGSFSLNQTASALLFIVLTAFGISVQVRELKREKR